MKVEVLYVADCPSHPAAVKLVKNVLDAEDVEAEIHEVLVRDTVWPANLDFAVLRQSESMDEMLRGSRRTLGVSR